MNAVTKIESAPKLMLLEFMADKYGLKPQEFADTVRKTCGLPTASPEEFAAFMMVAREYDLNPILREIFAFPKRGGGIVPIVSVDGWVNLVNSHPACDGFDFHVEHEGKELVSVTCSMYRKDRARPVVVTEYYDECKRDTDPWKMKHRMLRHKAMIQAARYAFGFSGIFDEDEGARVAEMRDITPAQVTTAPAAKLTPPSPFAAPSPPKADGIDPIPDNGFDNDTEDEGEAFDSAEFFEELESAMAGAMDEATVEEAWTALDPEATFDGDDLNLDIAHKIKNRRLAALSPIGAG